MSCQIILTSSPLLSQQIIPLYDNCGGSVPLGKQAEQFICEDSDPRTQPGDCVLWEQQVDQTMQYHMCVKAQRRTTFTNGARVYQANFKVCFHDQIFQRTSCLKLCSPLFTHCPQMPIVAICWRHVADCHCLLSCR